ncbi:MAG TPA: hypothetical protein VF903_08100, partial [Nitrospirota bacterium]
MDDLKTILDRIRKPLSFAARDDFAHVSSIADFDSFIQKQVDALRRVMADHHKLRELEDMVSG